MLEENMKVLRKLNNISQKELATKLFVTPQAVSKWERGESTPNPDALIKMADIFGVSIDYLLGASAIPTPASPTDADTGLELQAATDTEIKNAAAQLGRPLDETDIRLLELLKRATPEQKQAMLELLKQFQK